MIDEYELQDGWEYELRDKLKSFDTIYSTQIYHPIVLDGIAVIGIYTNRLNHLNDSIGMYLVLDDKPYLTDDGWNYEEAKYIGSTLDYLYQNKLSNPNVKLEGNELLLYLNKDEVDNISQLVSRIDEFSEDVQEIFNVKKGRM